ncbi:MAG: hypothetical protein J6T03_01165 [Bacteroidales bacterium]|nr:hypothetical protein [Bacteroidales bacterium]
MLSSFGLAPIALSIVLLPNGIFFSFQSLTYVVDTFHSVNVSMRPLDN